MLISRGNVHKSYDYVTLCAGCVVLALFSIFMLVCSSCVHDGHAVCTPLSFVSPACMSLSFLSPALHCCHLCHQHVHYCHLCHQHVHHCHLCHQHVHNCHICHQHVHNCHLCHQHVCHCHLCHQHICHCHLCHQHVHRCHLCNQHVCHCHLCHQHVHRCHFCHQETERQLSVLDVSTDCDATQTELFDSAVSIRQRAKSVPTGRDRTVEKLKQVKSKCYMWCGRLGRPRVVT